MVKDFNEWNTQKKVLDSGQRIFFRERDIWFASLGLNIGFEQNGKGEKYLRPVIVIRKFNNEIFWCLPLTKTFKRGIHYHSFKFLNQTSTAILSQIRLIDSKRLRYKVGSIEDGDFVKIREKLTQLLT